MRITDESALTRIHDAAEHDDVLIIVGELVDDDRERPLLTLSVNKDGDGFIEYEEGDLAAGIRQLNRILSGSLTGTLDLNGIRVVEEERR